MNCHCGKKATHGKEYNKPVHCKTHSLDDEVRIAGKCYNNNCSGAIIKGGIVCGACKENYKCKNTECKIKIDIPDTLCGECSKMPKRVTSANSNASFDANIASENVILDNYSPKHDALEQRLDKIQENILHIETCWTQLRIDLVGETRKMMDEHLAKLNNFEQRRIENEQKIEEQHQKYKQEKLKLKILDHRIIINILHTADTIWSIRGFLNEEHPCCIDVLAEIRKPGPKDTKSLDSILKRYGFDLVTQKSCFAKDYYRTKELNITSGEIIYDTVYQRDI